MQKGSFYRSFMVVLHLTSPSISLFFFWCQEKIIYKLDRKRRDSKNDVTFLTTSSTAAFPFSYM